MQGCNRNEGGIIMKQGQKQWMLLLLLVAFGLVLVISFVVAWLPQKTKPNVNTNTTMRQDVFLSPGGNRNKCYDCEDVGDAYGYKSKCFDCVHHVTSQTTQSIQHVQDTPSTLPKMGYV
jgi:hypothetical protein